MGLSEHQVANGAAYSENALEQSAALHATHSSLRLGELILGFLIGQDSVLQRQDLSIEVSRMM